MTAPSYTIARPTPSAGAGVTLALTLDPTPDNPVRGDLHLENGQIHLWDKAEARRQKIRMILLFGKGEYWLNLDEGIPYFPSIIGQKNKNIVTTIYRQAFLKTLPDLTQIRTLNLVFDPRTREATIDFDLVFDDGMIIKSSDFGALEIQI